MKRAKTHSSISPTDKFYLTQSLSEYKLNPRQLSEVFEALEQIENNKIENENVQFKCFERVETLKNVFIVLAVFLILTFIYTVILVNHLQAKNVRYA